MCVGKKMETSVQVYDLTIHIQCLDNAFTLLDIYCMVQKYWVTVKQTKLNDFISFISARRRAAALEEASSNLSMMNMANGPNGKYVTIITLRLQHEYPFDNTHEHFA